MVSKIFVTVKPGAKENKVIEIDKNHFRVSVKAPPNEGRANEAVVDILKKHLGLPKSCISIASGHKSKNKVIQISV